MSAPPWARAIAPDLAPDLTVAVLRAAVRPGVTPQRQRAALAARLEAGEPTAVEDVLDDLLRAPPPRAQPPASLTTVDEAARALLACHARLVVAGTPGYPVHLAGAWPELGAPAWLFVRSRAPADVPPLPAGPAVAVVGTRRATLDGRQTARELGAFLAARGVSVVSGMARGIDQEAHLGALGADGPTVAVLGTGFGVDYPRRDAPIRQAVMRAGGLVSEYLPGVGPRPHHFLWRNRIISGLSDAVVVVEGQARSGALHTARLAAAQGRDVFAVPGSLHVPTSRGPLDLVRDGAQVVTCFDDVLPFRALAAQASPPAVAAMPPPMSADAAAVLALLSTAPASPVALAEATGSPIGAVLAAVGDLTAHGLARVSGRGVVVSARDAGAPPGAGGAR